MLDQMTHLFRLQAVADAGSMRRAADGLNITQPALSRSISQLEARFGKPLLIRHARGVEPTDFGKRVIASIQRLSRHWELTEQELAGVGPGFNGRIRLRAGPLWRVVALPGLIARLQRRFPELTIEMQNGDYRNTIPDLQEGRCDVVFGGLQILDGHESRLASRHFTSVRDRVLAREDHPIFGGHPDKPVDPIRLLEYPWLVYTADPAYEFETTHVSLEKAGLAPEIRARCESLIGAIEILKVGDYLCILPDASVVNTSSPRIVPVQAGLDERHIRTGAIYRQEMLGWGPLDTLMSLCEEYSSAVSTATRASQS